MKTPRERLTFILKTVVGLGVVAFVVKSKMVDFDSLGAVLFSPLNMALALGFLTLSAVFCTARWLLLVRAQGLELSYKDLLSLTMIGNFFNTFMPGSVGGDLIKAWYIAGKEPQRRTRAIFTVLLDRVLGLAVIVFYAAVTLLFYTQWLEGRPELKVVAWSIWAFTATSMVVLLLFFAPWFWRQGMVQKTLGFFQRSAKLEKILDSGFLYQKRPRTVLMALFFSALSIFGFNFFYRTIGGQLGIEMTLAQYFVIVPLAMTASAIPLLPGGIGTGQVAFYTLFKWMGVANPDLGGTLCTIIQIYTILFNCLGYLFYIRVKRAPRLSPEMDSGLVSAT